MGLVDWGVEKESGRCWPEQSVLLAAGLADGPKSPKVQATRRTVKDLRAALKMHHLWRTINTCFSSFLIYLSSKRTLMDQTLKGDAGQCQPTTKVQGKKNCSFGTPRFNSTHGLVKGVWITSGRVLNKTAVELCPVLSADGQNTAPVTCHLNSRTTIQPSVSDREMIIRSDVSWNNSCLHYFHAGRWYHTLLDIVPHLLNRFYNCHAD